MFLLCRGVEEFEGVECWFDNDAVDDVNDRRYVGCEENVI